MGRYGSHTCRCARCGAEGHNARSCALPASTPIVADRRRGNPSGARPVVLGLREMRALVEADGEIKEPGYERPRTRGECQDGPRPCPWWSCQHHLGCDVTDVGTLRITWPGCGPDEIEETCSLDMADRGGATLEEIAHVLNLCRERLRQIEDRAVRKMRSAWAAQEKRERRNACR